jgi:lactoylglutathione lyase
MTRYLHTMYRITDPEKSRAFYEALGLEFRRDMDIVRGGEREATNFFFGVPGQDEELELTFNHDGRSYDIGTGYGHIALAVDDLDATLERLKKQGIEPEREPYRVREGGSRLCFVQDPDRSLPTLIWYHRGRAHRPMEFGRVGVDRVLEVVAARAQGSTSCAP